MTERSRSAWGVVIHHEAAALVELRWLPTTSGMSDDDFRATLALLASEAEAARPRALLIDATDFRHTPGPGVMEWRDREIIPRYNAAGVARFAFLVPESAPGTMEAGGQPDTSDPARFPTAWFSDRQRALEWLEGG